MNNKIVTSLLCLVVVIIMSAGCSKSISPDELLTESIKASSFQSFSLNMGIGQSMQQGAAATKMDSNMKLDIIANPLAMYQQVSMKVNNENELKFDTYVTPDGYYSHDLVNKVWTKQPSEMMTDVKASMSELQTAPAKELEKLRPYVEQLKATEQDKQHTLTLSLTGTGYEVLLKDLVGGLISDQPKPKDILKAAKVNKLEYNVVIDEETNAVKQIQIDTDLVLQVKDQSISLKQHIVADYSNVNGVKSIVVPEEGIKKAMESTAVKQ